MAGVVSGADPQWHSLLHDLLAHKGEPWVWQVDRTLRDGVAAEVRYYVLHRDGRPLANLMTAEHRGAGHLGHVWTEPVDRRQGAMRRLFAAAMEHARGRGVQALYLGTGYDSVPYHLYRSFGFSALEPQSGLMQWYAHDEAAYEGRYFGDAAVRIEPLGWQHWPASASLFAGDYAGVVRCAALQLVGRQTTEAALLLYLRGSERAQARANAAGGPAEHRGQAAVSEATGAVLGMAHCAPHPLWPGVSLLDLYCHPRWWQQAPQLLAALSLPTDRRCIAYADAECAPRIAALQTVGMRRVAAIAEHIVADAAGRRVELQVFARD